MWVEKGVAMARHVERLTDRGVKNMKEPGYHTDGASLYLQVSPAQTKSWIFRYTRRGKTREMGLGSYLSHSLKEARDSAKTQRQILDAGADPIEARDAGAAKQVLAAALSVTFSKCAETYIAAHSASWRNPKHAAQWSKTIETYAKPTIGPLPVQGVDTALVVRVLEPIWTTKPETASRLRGRIERVLDWAKVRGHRSGENPARWRGHLDKLLPIMKRAGRVKHHPALPYGEIGEFMPKVRAEPGTAARALEFTILNISRTGEVLGAKPAEFDLKKAIWTIPAARMKAGREHRVPLTSRSVELVKAQLEADPEAAYVFPGRSAGAPLSNMAMLELLRRTKRSDLTTHGFRSTFRDWAAECTNYPNELCEMALAHTLSDKVEAAYRRGDLFEKRRRLMADWTKYCNTPKAKGKVVPIRREA